jgi:hypothetical protein
VLNVRNRWLAYQVDEAVDMFGLKVEAELNRAKDDRARQRKLERLLSDGGHYVLDIEPGAWVN